MTPVERDFVANKISPGARLGPYEILVPIGEGGMGEVWKARDTRLDRTVAVKFSKVGFSSRFEREAKAIAALNHRHICTLYDVGPNYLVMEYVEGVEIKGPLPLAKTIELGCQILDALDAAHRKSITHRDLKPANIMVTKAGVKVLDFGLARMETTVAASDATTKMTFEGTIAGTLHYMAPEQLNGVEADARADIFAFGCVLYEMLTGKRAFDGATTASVIAAVLERPAPSVSEIAPASLDRVLKRCLEKDPDERWQSARDLKWELARAVGSGTEVPRQAGARPTLWIVATAVLLVVAASLAYIHFGAKPVQAPPVRFTLVPPEGSRFTVSNNAADAPAISPDGRQLVFSVVTGKGAQLFVRPLDGVTEQPLSGTEGGFHPFWSPDSKSIAFFAGGKLKTITATGGPVRVLADAGANRGGAWGGRWCDPLCAD